MKTPVETNFLTDEATFANGFWYTNPAHAPPGGGGDGEPEAAITALEITFPRAGLDSNNRIFVFDQEKLYRIPINVWGGSLPYIFEIVDGPGTIDQMGFLDWTPDSSVTTESWTIRVTDQEGTFADVTWTANRDNSRFKYVDNSNAAGGRNGSSANPWNTFPEAINNGAAHQLLRLRTGSTTYNVVGHGTVGTGGDAQRVECRTVGNCHTAIMPDDGHSPVFDWGYAGSGFCTFVSYEGPCVWVQGMTAQHDKIMNWRVVTSEFFAFFDNTFTQSGPGAEGSNAGDISIVNNGGGYGSVIRNNQFLEPANPAAGHNSLKAYGADKLGFWFNLINEGVGIDWKKGVTNFLSYGNLGYNVKGSMHTGNFDTQDDGSDETGGQIWYDRALGTEGNFCQVAHGAIRTIAQIDFVRCTTNRPCIIDTFGVDRSGGVNGANDGPMTWSHCVRVSDDDGVLTFENGSPGEVTITDSTSLLGADDGSIIDADTGELQGGYVASNGPGSDAPRGFQHADLPVVTI